MLCVIYCTACRLARSLADDLTSHFIQLWFPLVGLTHADALGRRTSYMTSMPRRAAFAAGGGDTVHGRSLGLSQYHHPRGHTHAPGQDPFDGRSRNVEHTRVRPRSDYVGVTHGRIPSVLPLVSRCVFRAAPSLLTLVLHFCVAMAQARSLRCVEELSTFLRLLEPSVSQGASALCLRLHPAAVARVARSQCGYANSHSPLTLCSVARRAHSPSN